MTTTPAPTPRIHIVLIPGFGGFDALGDLHYYAGITPLFRDWQTEAPDAPRANAILHYFDNLPTASVETRAKRLHRYLAKRIARNEIQLDDTIALIGHSTGGLDIRLLLRRLAENPQQVSRVDGDARDACVVRNEELLRRVCRVVFLSVPQRRTNIADWVRDNDRMRRLFTDALGSMFETSPLGRDGRLRRWVTGRIAELTGMDLFRAAEDAVRESDETLFEKLPADAAAAREAFAYLWLWTRNIASDFSAIDDLRHPAPADQASREAREKEDKALWDKYGITTRSYATLGPCPYDPRVLRGQGPWDLRKHLLSRETGLSPKAQAETDVVYQYCYRACAGGPFKAPPGENKATEFGTANIITLEDWDNDGIVNTASMLWPDGAATRLVRADHGDIIGHYQLVEVPPPDGSTGSAPIGRRYHTYDLLKSGARFGDKQFTEVWRDALDFCVT